MKSSSKSILWKIRDFNLICGLFGHSLGKPTPFLNTAKTGYCGNIKKCTRCPHEEKEYGESEITEYPRLS